MITFANLGKYGRLGNQMFQIASTIGVAVKSGFDYGFPVWQNIDHANKGFKEDIEIWNYFKNQLPLVIPGKYTESIASTIASLTMVYIRFPNSGVWVALSKAGVNALSKAGVNAFSKAAGNFASNALL